MIDGQGNFGNIDGDNPAADRYTEARLTEVAAQLLDGIDQDTVDFRPNYDGREQEPAVLPGNFPNLLANGASGIAVGMATNIPPHNAGELCDAALHLIKFPNATADKLVDFVPGPDLPTGGILVEPRESIVAGLQDRPRQLPLARALGERGYRPRHLSDRGHRDPLSGAQGAPRRPHRRAAAGQEAAAARRHPR